VRVVFGPYDQDTDHPWHQLERGEIALTAAAEQIKAVAAEEGLDYHFERYQVVNTFDAHRMAQLARSLGLGGEVHERLLRAQLVEGAILDDPDTLVRLAVEIGVPEAEARRVADSDAFTGEVTADIRLAQEFGITGVPFFVFDRRYGVSGAQPSEVFRQTLEAAFEDAAASD